MMRWQDVPIGIDAWTLRWVAKQIDIEAKQQDALDEAARLQMIALMRADDIGDRHDELNAVRWTAQQQALTLRDIGRRLRIRAARIERRAKGGA